MLRRRSVPAAGAPLPHAARLFLENRSPSLDALPFAPTPPSGSPRPASLRPRERHALRARQVLFAIDADPWFPSSALATSPADWPDCKSADRFQLELLGKRPSRHRSSFPFRCFCGLTGCLKNGVHSTRCAGVCSRHPPGRRASSRLRAREASFSNRSDVCCTARVRRIVSRLAFAEDAE